MPRTLTSYNIFIASPGGLHAERQAFREVVAAYNDAEAIPRGILFVPVGWELTLGGVGRPQAIINAELRDSDYFLMVLWNRWGSRPDTEGGAYSSGTEEEFAVALECLEGGTYPMRQLVAMFKAVDPQQLSDPGEQLTRVLRFRAQLESQQQHLFHTFDTLDLFKDTVRRHLGRWLRDHEAGGTNQSPSIDPSPLPASPFYPPTEVTATTAFDQQQLEIAEALARDGRSTEAETIFARISVRCDDPIPLFRYGIFLTRAGRISQAEAMLERGLELAERHSDRKARGSIHQGLGIIFTHRGEYAKAESAYNMAIDIARDMEDDGLEANAMGNLGALLATRGRLEDAQALFEKALDVHRKLGWEQEVAITLNNLARIRRVQKDFEGARGLLTQSLELLQAGGFTEGIPPTLVALGNVASGQGRFDEAIAYFNQGIDGLEKLGHQIRLGNAYRLLGNVHRKRGHIELALTLHERALRLAEALDNEPGIAAAHKSIGLDYAKQKNHAEALASWLKAAERYEAIGDNEALGQIRALIEMERARNSSSPVVTSVDTDNLLDRVGNSDDDPTVNWR